MMIFVDLDETRIQPTIFCKIRIASLTLLTLRNVSDNLLSVSFIRQIDGFDWTKRSMAAKSGDL